VSVQHSRAVELTACSRAWAIAKRTHRKVGYWWCSARPQNFFVEPDSTRTEQLGDPIAVPAMYLRSHDGAFGSNVRCTISCALPSARITAHAHSSEGLDDVKVSESLNTLAVV
jgi:hypothetical protein